MEAHAPTGHDTVFLGQSHHPGMNLLHDFRSERTCHSSQSLGFRDLFGWQSDREDYAAIDRAAAPIATVLIRSLRR